MRVLIACSIALAGCGGMGDGTTSKADLARATPDLVMVACGDVDQPCCANSKCNDPNAGCLGGKCALLQDTGAPCATAKECAGKNPRCIMAVNMIAYPGGYCSSDCDVARSGSDGKNPACGGGGVCVRAGGGTLGVCLAGCTGSLQTPNDRPCARMGYACFVGPTAGNVPVGTCLPAAGSKCDPTKAPACGAMKTCALVGYDPVGDCYDGCDPFLVDSCTSGRCYVENSNGAGFCTGGAGTAADGAACVFAQDCTPGLLCWYPGGGVLGSGKCAPPCRTGAKPVACKNGKKCVDLSKFVKTDTLGACAG